MKVLSVRVAKAIWLIPLIFINPRGRFMIPVAAALVQRYGFVKNPEVQALVTTPLTIKFEGGSFKTRDGTPIFVDLAVHDDGIVADTRCSTEESDLFIHDVLTWLQTEFQLPKYQDVGVKKLFSSELSIRFERPLQVFNERFQKFADQLNVGSQADDPNALQLTHLNFGSDPGRGARQVGLKIERELGVPFAENRYYSHASGHTADHIRLLEEFERAATG